VPGRSARVRWGLCCARLCSAAPRGPAEARELCNVHPVFEVHHSPVRTFWDGKTLQHARAKVCAGGKLSAKASSPSLTYVAPFVANLAALAGGLVQARLALAAPLEALAAARSSQRFRCKPCHTMAIATGSSRFRDLLFAMRLDIPVAGSLYAYCARSAMDDVGRKTSLLSHGTSIVRTILPIREMSSVSCAARIEQSLRKVDGITEAAVNFASESAAISYDSTTREPRKDRGGHRTHRIYGATRHDSIAHWGYDMCHLRGAH